MRDGTAEIARSRARGDHAARLDRAAIPRRDPPGAARDAAGECQHARAGVGGLSRSRRSTTANILVEQELRRDLPLLEVDRNQLKQAFYNVIKNAFQAMKTGGILRIRTDLDDHCVSITFADTGGGISPENMSKIFEPYFTTKASGSGLGLLIVRRIVREHGGEIDLVSDEGRGLTLTIRLPLRNQRARMLGAGTGPARKRVRSAFHVIDRIHQSPSLNL